jgi:hypothetical protein
VAKYEIRVAGQVAASEVAELEGMLVSVDGSLLCLSGEVVDQAALVGMLTRLTAAGLRVVGVAADGGPGHGGGDEVEVRLSGRAPVALSRALPALAVTADDGCTVVRGRLADDELVELLQVAQSLRLDVLTVRRVSDVAPVLVRQPAEPA